MENRNYDHLEGSDWELENKDQDLRGRQVLTEAGTPLGVVKDMLVDPDQERVAAVRLDDGRTLPVETLQIRREDVVARGIERPATEAAPAAAPESDEVRIPIVEEQIRVGKRVVGKGGVHVETRVVEEPVNERVVLREERVTVERRPVDAPVSDPESLLEERSFDAAERAEEPVVAKEAVVTDEVVIRKDTKEQTVDVDETLRRTEVNVEDDRNRRSPGT